jgi:hypothetical protein
VAESPIERYDAPLTARGTAEAPFPSYVTDFFATSDGVSPQNCAAVSSSGPVDGIAGEDLIFDFLATGQQGDPKVMTGHDDGLITLAWTRQTM